MKLVMLVFSALMAVSCTVHKEMEVEITNAELVKIDTLYRYPQSIKQLTWRDDSNTEFISVSSMNTMYKVGLKLPVLKKR